MFPDFWYSHSLLVIMFTVHININVAVSCQVFLNRKMSEYYFHQYLEEVQFCIFWVLTFPDEA